jgi:transposase-like protein
MCKKCKNTTHYWKKKREQWECKKCSYRTTVKSGTVMHNSKLSFQYQFITMLLKTSTKKSLSAKKIQKQIGYNRYLPIWEKIHKLRTVMG